jgi:predicted GNAT family N-acyltransferase
LIGNVNIYPTHMKPLDMLNNSNGQKISVWELWSVVIQPEFRWLGIGKQLTWFALQALWSSYDAVVSATVNDYMTHIFHDYWFHHIPFPKEYFEEGKLHLWPKMIWWVDEFVKKAKCFVLSSKDVQEYIVKILW